MSQAVCCLMVYDTSSLRADDTSFGEYLILQFQKIIPRLVRLRHLTWEVLAEYYKAHTIFKEFKAFCPQLQSITLWTPLGVSRLGQYLLIKIVTSLLTYYICIDGYDKQVCHLLTMNDTGLTF